MKNIKEMANEVFGDPFKQECFEAGANYVLDKIERCVKSSSNSRLKIDTIKQIIELLKK